MSQTTFSPEQVEAPPDIRNIVSLLPTAHDNQRTKRPLAVITKLVVHIDDVERPDVYDPITRYKQQANYHITKNWANDPKQGYIPGFGLMYHFKIAYTEGKTQIYQTQNLDQVLWHAHTWNWPGIAICIDSAAKQVPSQTILNTLHELLWWLSYRNPQFPASRADVRGHTEEPNAHKSCPALYMPWVRAFREGHW